MTTVQRSSLRWENYLIQDGSNFDAFWEGLLTERPRHLLYILGMGFDPRMCAGIKAIANASNSTIVDYCLIELDEGPNSPSQRYMPEVNANIAILRELTDGKGKGKTKTIKVWSDDGSRRVGSRRATQAINRDDLTGITDVIIDVSAMPRSIYFPLITKILMLADKDNVVAGQFNLHVVTAEDVLLDEVIQEDGIDEHATYLHGYSSDLEREANATVPRLWIPVLGKGKVAQLNSIYDQVKPDEICPVLPSPACNPRRADDLIIEYREFLFDRLRVDPNNIIYASERNPFEAYRQIYRTILHYNEALAPLGKCKVVVSALSSKLLSIGALLASYEAKQQGLMIGISLVETLGYSMGDTNHRKGAEELFSLVLAGESYHG